jgi:hypothetical protein
LNGGSGGTSSAGEVAILRVGASER